MSLKEIDEHIFLTRKPSVHMRNIVYHCGAKKNLIMGHYQVPQEMRDKQLWLDKYFPIIEKNDRIFLCENNSKADSIVNYCQKYHIDLADVVYVDDVIPFCGKQKEKE